MNLYLISSPGKYRGYDKFNSAVVAANSIDEARMVHPSGEGGDDDHSKALETWCPTEEVIVKYIGIAKAGINNGVISASFTAG